MELATADPNPLIHDLMETMSVGSSSTSSHSGSASFGRGRGALARARNGGAAERHGRPVSPRELVARSSPPGFATKGAPGRGPPPMWSAAQDFAMEETISSVYHNLRETLQLHKLDGYFQLNEEANWTALRNHIPSRGAPELSGMVLDLLRVLEDLRISFEQVPLDDADNMYDRSITSNVSTASLMRPPVHETHQVELAVDQEGHRMINCYTVLANLGRGSYGKVKLGEEVGTGKKVAIKIIDKRHLNRSYDGKLNANASDALTREITIMKKVRHRNCVSLLEVIDDPEWEKLYLVMDYIPNGPIVRLKQRRLLPAFLKAVEAGEAVQGIAFNRYLCRFATRQTLDEASVSTPLTSSEVEKTPTLFACKSVPQSLCTIYVRQLVSGLRYLHKRNVVHHDIKPDNILLGLNNNVYLTDFGVSEIFHPSNPSVGAPSSTDTEHSPSKPTKSTTMSFSPSGGSSGPSLSGRKKTSARLGGGTILFTAPELFSTSSDNVTDPFMTDVWALGITLYSMLVGIAPFFGECFSDIRDSITTKPFPWNGMSFENDPLIPQWKDILDGLLSKDPAMRWSLRQLKDYLESTPFQTAIEKQAVVDQARAAASASSAEHHNRRSPRRDIWSSSNNNNNNSMSILGAALGAKNNSAARQRRLGAAENGANEDDEPAATNTNIAAKRSAVPLLEVSDDRPPRLSSVAGSSLNKIGLFNGDRNNHDYHAHSGNLLKSYMQNTTSMRPRLDNQSDPLSFLRAKSLGNNKNATSPRSSKVATVGGAMAGTQLSAKSKAVIVRFVARIREKVQQREGKYFSDAQPRRGSDASSEFDSQEMDNMRIAITSQSPRVVAGAARWNSVPSPERDRQLMQNSYNYASSPLDPYVEAGRSAGMESIDAMLSIVNLPSSNSVSVSSSTASLFRRPPVQRTPTEKQQNFFDAQNNSVSLSGGMESPPTLVSPPAQPRSNTSPGASPQKQNAEQTKPATGGTTATRYSQGTSRSAAGNRPARGGPTTTPPSGSPNSTQPRHPLRPPHTHIPSNGLFPDKKEPRVKDGDRSSLPSSGPSSPTDPLVSNSSGSGKSTSGSKDRQTTRRVRAATSTARRGTSQNDRTNPVVPPKKESQSVNIPENISGANEQRLLRKAKSRTASRRTSQDRQPLAK